MDYRLLGKCYSVKLLCSYSGDTLERFATLKFRVERHCGPGVIPEKIGEQDVFEVPKDVMNQVFRIPYSAQIWCCPQPVTPTSGILKWLNMCCLLKQTIGQCISAHFWDWNVSAWLRTQYLIMLIGPDGLVNQGYVNFQKNVSRTMVHVPKVRIKHR